jgi:hypothetical protein
LVKIRLVEAINTPQLLSHDVPLMSLGNCNLRTG